ncbi:MAG: 30S ribosomal protein S5 [Candidatus Nanoarchaeia archaeon]|nr:30S ribosomal protein S5 [Candidatus Nanoarchaeia archaeon]
MKVGRTRLPEAEASKLKTSEDVPQGVSRERAFDKEAWQPKSELGKKVKSGEIVTIDEILDKGYTILEAGVVDALVSNLNSDLLTIGQSKGKFGGGKASIWRQTQKKTQEGNKASFATLTVVGNHDGYVGLGFGKSRETVPAREKALRKAKLNLIKIRRGCGSWECACHEPHSVPVKVKGKVTSVELELMPAPKGTGIVAQKEVAKILAFAGIKDVYANAKGHTASKLNLLMACFEALKNLSKIKLKEVDHKTLGVIEGNLQ